MMMKSAKVLLLFWSMLLPAPGSSAASADAAIAGQLFATGNSEYQKGDYASAERYFSRILESGAESGAVYYNLGNAYFKQRKLGQAIYCWEKARQKMPGDRDTRENLELAGLLMVDRIETPADPMPLRVLTALPSLFTIEQESRLVIVLFVLANILLSVYLLARNSRRSFGALAASLVIGFLFVVFGCSLAWKIYQRDSQKSGIVIEQKVDVRSGPGPQNIAVFTIHEGIRVRVHRSAGGWYQISLPNGWNGWLPGNFVRIL